MAEVCFKEVETYASCFQNTAAKYITYKLIMDLFLAAKRRPGSKVKTWWWEQEGLDLEVIRTAAQE